jgi:hypothetical protein
MVPSGLFTQDKKFVHPRVARIRSFRIEASPEQQSRDFDQPRQGDLKFIRISKKNTVDFNDFRENGIQMKIDDVLCLV